MGHEHVRPAFHLGDARHCGGDVVGKRLAGGYYLHGNSRRLDGVLHVQAHLEELFAIPKSRFLVGLSGKGLVTHDAIEFNAGQLPGQFSQRDALLDSTRICPSDSRPAPRGGDFDNDSDGHAVPPRRFRQRAEIAGIVNGHPYRGALGNGAKPGDLVLGHDLIGDLDISNAALDHDLGLGDFGAAYALIGPAGAELHVGQ